MNANFYALKPDGSYRAVTPDMTLDIDETLVEVLPEPTPEQQAARLLAEMSALLYAYIDTRAKERNYNDSVACASYAASTVSQWAAEARTFIAWRDSVWVTAYEVMYQVQSGQAAPPAWDELVTMLPPLIWP